MNPWKIIWCVNPHFDYYLPMRRWQLWWCWLFGTPLTKQWKRDTT